MRKLIPILALSVLMFASAALCRAEAPRRGVFVGVGPNVSVAVGQRVHGPVLGQPVRYWRHGYYGGAYRPYYYHYGARRPYYGGYYQPYYGGYYPYGAYYGGYYPNGAYYPFNFSYGGPRVSFGFGF